MTDSIKVYPGDCMEVLATLAPDSIDACVTDPPYGINFMGKKWDKFDGDNRSWADFQGTVGIDHKKTRERRASMQAGSYDLSPKAMHGFQDWCTVWAREVYRVLNPGGHIVVFGSTRTFHRMACAIEDAGFEIRDTIMWLYGSGFPKSHDVSKGVDRAAGVERERYERSAFGRSFSDDNGTTYGTAIVNTPATDAARQWEGWGTALKPSNEMMAHYSAVRTGTRCGPSHSISRNCYEPKNYGENSPTSKSIR